MRAWLKLTLTFYDLHFVLAMRHSIKERMTMKKETIKSKPASRFTVTNSPVKPQQTMRATSASKVIQDKTKKRNAFNTLIKTAILEKKYIFTLLVNGTIYIGLPTKLDGKRVTLKDVFISDTKLSIFASEFLLYLSESSSIAVIKTLLRNDLYKSSESSSGANS